jgi:hypothetical protein
VYLSTVQEVTPSQPSVATPPKATRHILFAAVLTIAACLRIITMLAYRPGSIYYDDSYSYLDLALHPRPAQGFRNTGYPLLLWLLRPFHSVLVVLTVQHVLGLAMGIRRPSPACCPSPCTRPGSGPRTARSRCPRSTVSHCGRGP